MKIQDAIELAYKNGYNDGYEAGVKELAEALKSETSPEIVSGHQAETGDENEVYNLRERN